MKTIKILAARHYDFDSYHGSSILLENVITQLRKTAEVTVIWLVALPEKLEPIPELKNSIILDIHDFKNAIDVLEATKPDVIYDSEYPSLLDISLNEAGKFLGIPSISIIYNTDISLSKKQLVTSFIPQLFHNRLPFEVGAKKQFMRRGRFFFYKLKFLINTKKKIIKNSFALIKYICIILEIHFKHKIPFIDKRFSTTVHFLESEILVPKMVDQGFTPDCIKVIGNPLYDEIIKKFKNNNFQIKKNEKLNILFLPLVLYEGGLAPQKHRDFTVQKIIQILSKNKSRFNLIVKLHPSSHRFSDYKELIHSVDSSIEIFQNEDVIPLIENADIIISNVSDSTVLRFSVLAKKPLVLCNFFNYPKNFYLEKEIGIECKKPETLLEQIDFSINNWSEKKYDDFIKSLIYKADGYASERMSKVVLELIKTEN